MSRNWILIPDLDCFERIQKFHQDLCLGQIAADEFVKFVKRTSSLPQQLRLKSLQSLHRKLQLGEILYLRNSVDMQSSEFRGRPCNPGIVSAAWRLVELCRNDNASDIRDQEEDYSDDENDATVEDSYTVHPVFLNIDSRIEHTQNFDAVSSREDRMLVDPSEEDRFQGTVDFKQNSLLSEREQVHSGILDEILILCEQEGSLEDDEDDNGWNPYGAYTRWFCINRTMPNLDNALHCDMCREH